ncbi:MoaD/ThiS family protein [Rhodococcus aerolatus]
MTAAVRVVLPTHLATLARCGRQVDVPVAAATVAGVLDAVEERFPVLRGTLRDTTTGRRRAFVRFFACEQDLSHDPPDAPLPAPVAQGREPLLVVGAMAGG